MKKKFMKPEMLCCVMDSSDVLATSGSGDTEKLTEENFNWGSNANERGGNPIWD